MPTEVSRAEQRRRRRLGCILTTVVLTIGGFLGVYGIRDHVVPGLTPQTCRVTAGGATVTYSPEQAENAATIAAVGVRDRLSHRAVTIAMATAIQESKLRNLDHGDRDSIGLFQQRPSQGWGTAEQIQDPVYATERFYERLVTVRGYLDRPLTDVAQDVQRSGFPEAYAEHEDQASLLASAFMGDAHAAVTCRLAPPRSSTSARAIVSDLDRQLGVSPAPTRSGVVAVLSSEDLAWATAHWAVAHAERAGITSVTLNGRTWTRGRAADAARWNPGPSGDRRNQVIITVGRS